MQRVARYISVFAIGLLALATACHVPELQKASLTAGTERANLGAAERHRVIDAVIADLNKDYFSAETARKAADVLLADEKRGDYATITDRAAFADALTARIRDVSKDMHLVVVYSREPLPDRPPGPPLGVLERYREAMLRTHCNFEKVQILPHRVGYFKLNSFPDPAICREAAKDAMARLNGADAIIFDLRDNTGGYPEMVSLIASYLFDHPEYMYNPRENATAQSWTHSPVPGSKLANKPVYVLTSARTFSGAEQFSYDLKMLKRATLVGETTRGGAHAGVFHRIDEHFGIGIPEVRPINPYAKTDWEGTGVQPDIQVKAADALNTAERSVKAKLRACGP